MKKIKYLLFTLLMGFAMITNVYAKESIEIKSITLDTKSENTVVNSEPTFSGLEMNYDLTFKQVNDFAKYKIVIENNTNKDYKVSEDKSFSISEYVTYKYESAQTIKANETSTLFVIITYNKEVDTTLLVEGKYKETNKAVLQMTDENNVPAENPKTGASNAILILLLTGVLSVCIVIMINRQQKSITLVILLALCLVPMITKAIEELKLTINVSVEIQKVEETPVVPDVPKYEVKYYIKGETAWIKEDELDHFDISQAQCETQYVGLVDNEHKYNVCRGLIIYKDLVKYAEGQTAPLQKVTLKKINCIILRSAAIEPCNADSEQIDSAIEGWTYSAGAMSNYGYTALESDKEVMNFPQINTDNWDRYGELLILAPTTFTMPGHDVIFYIDHSVQLF